MVQQKTISVRESTWESLDKRKPDNLTWDQFLNHLLQEDTTEDELLSRVEDLEALVDQVPARTADQLESRLR